MTLLKRFFRQLSLTVAHPFSFLCCVCVFMFWVPCCDARYDFRIITMFGSSLPPVVLSMLFVFDCIKWCPTHIVLCFVLFCFSSSCTLCCQFLWIFLFWLPLRCSLTFMYHSKQYSLLTLPLQSLGRLILPGGIWGSRRSVVSIWND